jgi:GNAT superfamily N-acetyltransferase
MNRNPQQMIAYNTEKREGSMKWQIKTIKDEETLKTVLDMCYGILSEQLREAKNYRYEDWQLRLQEGEGLLFFASCDGKVVSAALGRRENERSLILGFAVCEPEYKRQGITKSLVKQLEQRAKEKGCAYITLGADPHAYGFYEKCGYAVINEMNGQKIYQKRLC